MMHTYSLAKMSHALQKKTISSTELTQFLLTRIQASLKINAFISLDADYALQSAKQSDEKIALQQGGALTGIPIAHKDNICTRVMRTTCASKMLAEFVSPYDASVVQYFSDYGCVMLGKTNLDEFAMGSSNENSFFGAALNPWNIRCTPGGSSGGSAAAVAARLVPLATGTDTGGSIRQPAAFCGVCGLKPTYGLISRNGIIAYASSFDQAGLLAQTAEDLAISLAAIARFDENDSTSISVDVPNYVEQINKPLRAIKIGLPHCFFHPDVDPAIQNALSLAIRTFEKLGATIIELDLQTYETWIPCYYTLACAEASSNLARYDGVHFGHRSQKASSWREMVTQSRSEGFGTEVKRRILTGTYLLSSQHFDAYYVHAQKIRRKISQDLQQALSQVDLLLGPTTPTLAYPLDKTQKSAIHHQLSDIFTVPANLAGLPALSIPAGQHQGLPIGMQLMGAHFSEALLLQVAHAYQRETDWHAQIPPAFAGADIGDIL